MRPYGTLDDPVANDASALTPEQKRVRELFLDPPAPRRSTVIIYRLLYVSLIGVVGWFLWQYAACVIRGAC